MNIVGLGKAGCAIADALSQHPQYMVYKIDAGAEGDFDFLKDYEETPEATKMFTIPEQNDPEKYEEVAPRMKSFFQGINGDVVFVVSGGAKVSGACLTILEQIKHCKITILYIKPNPSTLDSIKASMQRVCFGVLQEYARSAVFERFIAIDNDVVEAILGDVPIIGYYDKLNELIVWAFHMYNVLRHTEPVMGKVNETKVTCRISTLGTVDLESGEEKLFFPLDNVREKSYYYVLKNEDLISSGKLLKKINEQVKSLTQEGARGSYAIYSSEYNQNFILCAAHTPHIQPAQE
jgi:hypothetical protein